MGICRHAYALGKSSKPVQCHSSLHQETWPADTHADMTMTVFGKTETTQSPGSRCVRTGVNSGDDRPRRLLLNRKRPQGAAMTAKFVLISSVCTL
ncbi:MAG TPA: hypothetical protein EYM79_01720 [Planctomycetes bacterium]|nr:hypothetical protein [Planctomycetota bacterium]